MLRIVLFGSVGSSEATLRKLIEHKANVIGVFGLAKPKDKIVSGYVDLSEIATKHKLPYYSFDSVKDTWVLEELQCLKPDLIFVVGLSQLIPESIINLAKHGAVGFHPTDLPKGRGRAPIAWTVLNEKQGAANFFKISAGVDDGPIYVKERFKVEGDDDAGSIELKIIDSIHRALDRWLPKLLTGDFSNVKQNEDEAYYYEKRTHIDGVINWDKSSDEIHGLVRASSHPHPGAFSFFGDNKVIVWKTEKIIDLNVIGVVGRIVRFVDKKPVVQTGNGLLKLIDYTILDYFNKESGAELFVGSRLGYYNQNEIYRLRNRLNFIEKKMAELMSLVNKSDDDNLCNDNPT